MQEKSLDEELLDVPKNELNMEVNFGLQEIGKLAAIEARLLDHQAFLTSSSPSFGYFSNMKASDAAAPVGELGLMVTKATQKLKEV